ncbi:class I SAM-dependent methyltransferase [Phytohabitans rumicis]|uniref:class I SAM-dependent methyltransferase n=1 Tax=Phytohabitans rumicis TaxID=1076125 RepID=UPI0031EAACA2
MTGVFGAVADMYDDVRPGYPPDIADAVLDYHGGVPGEVVELGAGTGKGTAVLARLGAPLTCVEPDPRMAAVLGSRFPQARVHLGTFEQWAPPAGGVPLIACAMAWHWLDEATRNQRVRAALAPGGTLAVFGHKYDYADPVHAQAIADALHAADPGTTERTEGWFVEDIAGSGLFVGVEARVFRRHESLSTERYLQLVQTFSPFRRRSPDLQARALAALRSTVDGFGGAVVLDLRTTLALARRPS